MQTQPGFLRFSHMDDFADGSSPRRSSDTNTSNSTNSTGMPLPEPDLESASDGMRGVQMPEPKMRKRMEFKGRHIQMMSLGSSVYIILLNE